MADFSHLRYDVCQKMWPFSPDVYLYLLVAKAKFVTLRKKCDFAPLYHSKLLNYVFVTSNIMVCIYKTNQSNQFF
jgi:hypothetical protein